ncbi:MAG: hypothetical protein M5U26_27280 [Planctomycetota bacterium]|nr:hypothetical protein [Planctomycetota bacterium]
MRLRLGLAVLAALCLPGPARSSEGGGAGFAVPVDLAIPDERLREPEPAPAPALPAGGPSAQAAPDAAALERLDWSSAPVRLTLHGAGAAAALRLSAGGVDALNTNGEPLWTETKLSVRVRSVALEQGGLAVFDLRNETEEAQAVPAFRWTCGFGPEAKYVNPARCPRLSQGGQRTNHPRDAYPGVAYSPIAGFGEHGLFVGAAFLYDAANLDHLVGVRNYRDGERWVAEYAPLGPWPDGKSVPKQNPPALKLAPGASRRYALAFGAAPLERWYTAFEAYKRFLHASWGEVRYERDPRPIAAFSFGIQELIGAANPKGHSYRLDLLGWKDWVDRFLREQHPRGWRKTMIWQVAGSYAEHRGANMVFEIGTGVCEKGRETAGELKRLYERDVTVGLWMGRAASLSAGFDSGERWPIDTEKAEDRAIWERELDLVRAWGIRLTGLDDTSHGQRTKWAPSNVEMARKFFPYIRGKYPDHEFPIETAACDFTHLWGPSIFPERFIPRGKPEYAEWLSPGVVFYPIFKKGMTGGDDPKAHLDPNRLQELMDWSYVPIVFQYPSQVFDLTRRPVAAIPLEAPAPVPAPAEEKKAPVEAKTEDGEE